jgi:PAS domain S-box-containing protein
MARPNPQIDLGAVDASVALILCDLEQADCPIVYASDAFSDLTGYPKEDFMGRNCRFLQAPPPKLGKSPKHIKSADKAAIHRIRQAVANDTEIQVQITNYRKNGQRFINILSIVPIALDPDGHRYSIGVQVERE